MKTHTKLRLGGIALLIVPALILAVEIARQLSEMNQPDAGQLKLRWAFYSFLRNSGRGGYADFCARMKDQYLKNEARQKRFDESKKSDSE